MVDQKTIVANAIMELKKLNNQSSNRQSSLIAILKENAIESFIQLSLSKNGIIGIVQKLAQEDSQNPKSMAIFIDNLTIQISQQWKTDEEKELWHRILFLCKACKNNTINDMAAKRGFYEKAIELISGENIQVENRQKLMNHLSPLMLQITDEEQRDKIINNLTKKWAVCKGVQKPILKFLLKTHEGNNSIDTIFDLSHQVLSPEHKSLHQFLLQNLSQIIQKTTQKNQCISPLLNLLLSPETISTVLQTHLIHYSRHLLASLLQSSTSQLNFTSDSSKETITETTDQLKALIKSRPESADWIAQVLLFVFSVIPAVVLPVIDSNSVYKAIMDSDEKVSLPLIAHCCSSLKIRQKILSSKSHLKLSEVLELPRSDSICNAAALLAMAKLTSSSEEVRHLLFSGEPASLCLLSLTAQLQSFHSSDFPTREMLAESLCCLALNVEFKRLLTRDKTLLGAILAICRENQSVRGSEQLDKDEIESAKGFGVIRCLFPLAMSKEDYSTLLPIEEEKSDNENSEEMNELRKVARKGLIQRGEMSDEILGENAGTVAEVRAIRRELVRENAMEMATEYFRHFLIGKDGNCSRSAVNFQLWHGVACFVHNLVGRAGVAEDSASHGLLVQQGAVSTLLVIAAEAKKERTKDVAISALARILITINPNFIEESQIAESGRILIKQLKNRNELKVFEAAMALTNLASDEKERERLIEGGVWKRVKELYFSENYRVQRVALELQCNLLQCEKGIEMIRKSNEDLKILILFCKSGDEQSSIAALTAIAFLSTIRNGEIINNSPTKIDYEFLEETVKKNKGTSSKMAEIILQNINRG